MRNKAFEKALHVIAEKEYSVSLEKQGDSMQSVGRFTFSNTESLALIQKCQETNDFTIGQAIEAIKSTALAAYKKKAQKKGPGNYIFLGFILFSLLSSSLDLSMEEMLPYILIILFAAALIRHFATSRTRRMKKIWKNRAPEADGLLLAVDEMMKAATAPLLSLINIPVTALLFALLIGSGYLAVRPHLPDPLHERLAWRVHIGDDEQDLEWALDMVEDLSPQQLPKTLDKTFAYLIKEKDNPFMLALVVRQLHDENKLEKSVADSLIDRAIAATDLSRIDKAYELEQLASLLDSCSETVTDDLLSRTIALADQYPALMSAFGRYYSSRLSTKELLAMHEKNGSIPAFLQGALAQDDIAATDARLSDLTDAQQQLIIAQCAAVHHTAPNDVLAYLRMAAGHGFSAASCYPDGALLDWDLTHLNVYAYTEEPVKHTSWLPVVRMEAPEKMECKLVSAFRHSLGNDFESVYEDDYESNNALGQAAFTLMLDTEMLDKMSADSIPQTIEELTSLLVIDQQYIRSGTLRNTHYHQNSGENGQLTLSDIIKQEDYPVYSVAQLVDLYDLRSGLVDYRFNVNLIMPPDIPQRMQSGVSAFTMNDDEIARLYIAVPDDAWLAAAREDFITLMEDSAWNLQTAILLDYLTPDETIE